MVQNTLKSFEICLEISEQVIYTETIRIHWQHELCHFTYKMLQSWGYLQQHWSRSRDSLFLVLMVTFAFDHSVKSQGIKEISVTMIDSSKQKFTVKDRLFNFAYIFFLQVRITVLLCVPFHMSVYIFKIHINTNIYV